MWTCREFSHEIDHKGMNIIVTQSSKSKVGIDIDIFDSHCLQIERLSNSHRIESVCSMQGWLCCLLWVGNDRYTFDVYQLCQPTVLAWRNSSDNPCCNRRHSTTLKFLFQMIGFDEDSTYIRLCPLCNRDLRCRPCTTSHDQERWLRQVSKCIETSS